MFGVGRSGKGFISNRMLPLAFGAILLVTSSIPGWGQTRDSSDSILKRHYDLAQKLQGAGDLSGAASQYRIFIADAMAELAIEAAGVPDYARAVPLFEEALRLAPRSPGLMVRYAQAALAAKDWPRTTTLAKAVLKDYPGNVKAAAKANLILGRMLSKTNQETAARTQFEAAVALDPNFENGYALAIADLDLDDDANAAKVFAEMIAGFGDNAGLRIEIGRAYLNSDFQQRAIPEFQKAISENEKQPGVHYLLAQAYLTVGGESRFDLARAELDKELSISPNDAATHAQLGNIDLQQHQYDQADVHLQKALSLDRNDPNSFLLLGQLLSARSRDSEAIAAYRQSILLTRDVSSNRYQVQKAHYLLGRLLIKAGQLQEGKQEMEISSLLLKRSLRKDRDRLAGESDKAYNLDLANTVNSTGTVSEARTKTASMVNDFRTLLAPAVADSYNNLGVIAATQHFMDDALTDFQRAYEWNPLLPSLDSNWGLAAFQAGRYAEAVAPLARSLKSNPADGEIRAHLAISLSKIEQSPNAHR